MKYLKDYFSLIYTFILIIGGFGWMYYNDYDRYNQTLEKTKNGDSNAQYYLGHQWSHENLYLDNNIQQATYWYTKSAEQNNADAQFELAEIYKKSDIQKAFYWYKKSALGNNAQAQYKLAELYETGNGGEKSNSEAFKWYEIGAKKEYTLAQYKMGEIFSKGQLDQQQNKEKAIYWYKIVESKKGKADQSLSLSAHLNRTYLEHPIESLEPKANYTSYPSTYSVPITKYSYSLTSSCNDGSYSSSVGKKGACSHHGGVRH